MKFCLAFLFLFLILPGAKAQAPVKDPLDDFLKRTPLVDTSYGIHKVSFDLNNDGVTDIGYSNGFTGGSAGATWIFYLRLPARKGYRYYDAVEVIDMRYACLRTEGSEPPRLLYFLRNGCCAGVLVELAVTATGLKQTSSRAIKNQEPMFFDGEPFMRTYFAESLKPLEQIFGFECVLDQKKDCRALLRQ